MPYIKEIVILCTRSTPQEYLDFLDERFIPYMIVGYEQADLETALDELNLQLGVKMIRVDSGGVLNGILFQTSLVDKVHVLIHPVLEGKAEDSIYNTEMGTYTENIQLKLFKVDR